MKLTKRFLLISLSLFILGIIYTGCEEKSAVDKAISGYGDQNSQDSGGSGNKDSGGNGNQGSGGQAGPSRVSDEGLFMAKIPTKRVDQPEDIPNLNIVFVKENGNGDGTSWGKAYNDLQKAINKAYRVAQKYNKTVIVRVAQGTYKPNSHPNGYRNTSSRGMHFSLRNGVEVIGGYSGNGNDNSPDIYETILSGDIGTENYDADNVYHVFYHPDGIYLDNTAKLTGVTITKGSATGYSLIRRSGGGMFNDENSSPTLTNCKFTNNEAIFGGGMFNYNSSPELNSCEFTDNYATFGGGMYNYNNSSPTLNTCTFSGNTAYSQGGAVYSTHNSNPKFDDYTKRSFTPIDSDPNGKDNGNFGSS